MRSQHGSEKMKDMVFKKCQELFPGWSTLSCDEFEFDDPKGFSFFTMGIRSLKQAQPAAVLYRQLEGKENAILDFETEKEIFLTLSQHEIATQCLHYDKTCRIEAFYQGRTLTIEDLAEPDHLRQIANQLYRFHQLRPQSLPRQSFFELLLVKWGHIAKRVLEDEIDKFPPNEQEMCIDLREIYSPGNLLERFPLSPYSCSVMSE